MGRLALGLFVVLFASANALYPLIPGGKELIYNYRSLVHATADAPVPYGSAFVLDGNLHVQTDKNSSFIRFSDLKYTLYNGEYSEWDKEEIKVVPIPKELEAFENTFKVVYEPCGHAWGIAVEKDEPQYVINVKRGIASFMQMYTEKLDWSKKIPYSFHAKENTLYGKGPHYYTVYPGTDDWTVKKMAEPHTNYHMYSHLSTESEMSKCDVKFDEPLARSSAQMYHIIQKDGAYVMDHVESSAGIGYMPHGGQAYTFYLEMNQTLHLEKIIDAAAPMTIKTEKFYNGLTFYTADFSDMLSLGDIMHGRRTFDMDKMLVDLEEMLYDTIKYMEEYHLDMKAPDWARAQLVNRMFNLMLNLDESHLEAMAKKLVQKTSEEDKYALHIFYYMLPMIGSNPSYMYMFNQIKNKQVKDKVAFEWLEHMAFYTKTPNKMLIENMSEMLNWGDEISVDVRKSAILAFGTFLEKAIFSYNKMNHINNWPGHEGHENVDNFTPDFELEKFFPGPKYYEKYITILGEKLHAAKDHGMRSVYISALHNTRMEKAVHYLWPIARGELFAEDHYLRFLAVTSMGGLVNKNEELIYEIFWPLMTDYKLNTNIRVFAFYQIMKTHPSVHRMANLMWQMYAEPNYAFYQFFYSYIETLVHTSDPCMQYFSKTIKQLIGYLPRPEFHGMTRYIEFDYYDEKYEYGHQFESMLIHALGESETTLKIKMSRTLDNAKFELWGLLIHVDGMEASIFEDVMLYMKDSNKMFNFEKVWKAYQNIYNNKEIHIDIGITSKGQVIKMMHFDASNIKYLQSTFTELFVGDKFNYMKKFLSLSYNMQTIIVMPTDMGFPAVFKTAIPTMYMFDIDFSKVIVNNLITWKSDIHMKHSTNGLFTLSFYNPFIDMFQGVDKLISFDWQQPLYFDLSFNPTQQSMKLSWKRHDDPKKDVFGAKSYSAIFTYFRDDFKTGLLQTFCPKSKNWEMVTFGDEHRDTHVLYDEDSSNTGLHHIVSQFDSDKWASNMSLYDNSFWHMPHDGSNWFSQWFLAYYHRLTNMVLQPYPYANGILSRYEVSKEYPVTNIDMNIRFTRDYKRGDLALFPATKWNMRATYSVKNKDTTVKTWDANLILDSDVGHTTTTYKAILSRIIPGQKELRMCVDGVRKYTADGMEGDGTVAMAYAMEPKCTKDEKIMEIKTKAEKSWEQLENKHIYAECEEPIWSDLEGLHSLACYYARDTFRKWTYDFKTFDMPNEFKKYMHDIFYWGKLRYMNYLTKMGESSEKIEENSFKVIHEYPLAGKKVNMYVYTPETEYKFAGIPSHKFPMYRFHMMTTKHLSPMFAFMHRMGWSDTCQIHHEFYYNATDVRVDYMLPEQWTMYHGNADSTHGVWMKKLDAEKSAMKMQHGEHSLEIVPVGKKSYEISVDGQKLPANTYQYEQRWFWLDSIKDSGIVSVFCMHTGNFIAFDGHHLLIERPHKDLPYYGKCA